MNLEEDPLLQLEPLTIDAYSISLYSYEDMLKIAGDRIIFKYKYKSTESKNASAKITDPGYINDYRAGTLSLSDRCVTCARANCEGHMSIIKFGKDNEIINPLFTRTVIMLLNVVCQDCSRLLF